jgi:hypothetical protein
MGRSAVMEGQGAIYGWIGGRYRFVTDTTDGPVTTIVRFRGVLGRFDCGCENRRGDGLDLILDSTECARGHNDND